MTEAVGKVSGAETSNSQERIAKREIAFKDGKTLYTDLHGFTSKKQQANIARIIKNTDSAYVGKLLGGYHDALTDYVAASAGVGGAAGSAVASPTLAGAIAGAAIGGAVGAGAGAVTSGDRFFKQMNSEYSFPQKEELMMDMTKKCREKLQSEEKPDIETKEGLIRLDRIIKQGKIYDSDIDNLDDIATKIRKKEK